MRGSDPRAGHAVVHGWQRWLGRLFVEQADEFCAVRSGGITIATCPVAFNC
jgi:hypothetical protein